MEFMSNKDIREEVEITTKYTSWNREWMMALSQYEAQLSLINSYIYINIMQRIQISCFY